MTFAFVVSEVFLIKQRGTVVVPGRDPCLPLHVGDPVELRSGGEVPLRTKLLGFELLHVSPPPPPGGPSAVGILLPLDVHDHVGKGHEVWVGSPAEMMDEEIVAHLKFSEEWYRLGIMDDQTLRGTVENFRKTDDMGDEHWRYGAFMYFMSQHPRLTGQQCSHLFELGARDPDDTMGQSIMIQVLERPECPRALRERAAVHPRTEKYFRSLP